MTLKIQMNLDGAAFADGEMDEVVRCITESLEQVRGLWPEYGRNKVGIRDINGNLCGWAEVDK